MLLKVPDEAKAALHSLIASVHGLVTTEVKAGRYQLTLPKIGEPIPLVQTLSSGKPKTPIQVVYEDSAEIPFLAQYYNLLCTVSEKLWPMIHNNVSVIGTVLGLLPDVGTVIDGLNLAKKYGLLPKDLADSPVDLLLKKYEEDLEFAQLKLLFNFYGTCHLLPEGLVKPLNVLFEEYKENYACTSLKQSLIELYKKHGLFPKDYDNKKEGEKREIEQQVFINQLFGKDASLLDAIKQIYFGKVKPDLLRLIADKKGNHFAWILLEQLFPIAEFFLNNFAKIFFQYEKLLIVRPEYYLALQETIKTLKTILQVISKAPLGEHTRNNINFVIDAILKLAATFGATPPTVETYQTMLSMEAPDKAKLDERFIRKKAGNDLMDFLIDVSSLDNPLLIKYSDNMFLYYVNDAGETKLEPLPPTIQFTGVFTSEIDSETLEKPFKPDIFVEEADEAIDALSGNQMWMVQVSKIPHKQTLDEELGQYQKIVEQQNQIESIQYRRIVEQRKQQKQQGDILKRFCLLNLLHEHNPTWKSHPNEIFFQIKVLLFSLSIEEYQKAKISLSESRLAYEKTDEEYQKTKASVPKLFYYAKKEKQPRLFKHKNSLWIYRNSSGHTTLEQLKNPSFNIEFPETPHSRSVSISNKKTDYEKQCVVFNAKSEILNKHKTVGLTKLWCAHNDLFEVIDRAIDLPLSIMTNDGYRLGLKEEPSPGFGEFLIASADQSVGVEGIVYALKNANSEIKEGVISHEQLQATLGDRYKAFLIALENKDLPTLQTFLRDLLNIVEKVVAPTVFKPFVMNSLKTVPAPVNQDLKFWQDLDENISTVFGINQNTVKYLNGMIIPQMTAFLVAVITDKTILESLQSSYQKYTDIVEKLNQSVSELNVVRKEMALERKLADAPEISFFDPVVDFKSLTLVEKQPAPRKHVTQDVFKSVLEKVNEQSLKVDKEIAEKINAFTECTDFLGLAIMMEKHYLAVLAQQTSLVKVCDISSNRNEGLMFALQLSRMIEQGFVWDEIEKQNSQLKQFFPELKAWYAVRWQNDLKPLHANLIQQIFQHDVKKAAIEIKIDIEEQLKEFVKQLTSLTAEIDDASEEELSQLEETFNQIAVKKSLFDTKLCLQVLSGKIASLVSDPFYQALAKEYFASPSALSELASIQDLSEYFSAQLKSFESAIKDRRNALLLDSGNAIQKITEEIKTHHQQVEKDRAILQEIFELDQKHQDACIIKIGELKQNEIEIIGVAAKKSKVIKLDKKAYAEDLMSISREMMSATDPGCLKIQEDSATLVLVIESFQSNRTKAIHQLYGVQNNLIESAKKQQNALIIYESLLDLIIKDPKDKETTRKALEDFGKHKADITNALGEDKYSATMRFIEKFETERMYFAGSFKADLGKCKVASEEKRTEWLSLQKTCESEQAELQVSDKSSLGIQQKNSGNISALIAQKHEVRRVIEFNDAQIKMFDGQLQELAKVNKDLNQINEELKTSFDAREILETSLQTFSDAHEIQLQEKYSTLSSPVVLTSDKTDVSVQDTEYLKGKDEQLGILEYRLALCQLKKDLMDMEESLRELEKKINAFQVPDAMFRHGATINSLLSCRWEIHEGLCESKLESSERLLAEYDVFLNALNNKINELNKAQEKLEGDERLAKDKSSSIPLQKNAKMVARLFELKDQIVEACDGHKLLLEVEKEYFIGESMEWKGHHQNLMSAQKLFEQVNSSIAFLEKRSTDVVQHVVNAKCEPEAILKEDEYFRILDKVIQDYKTEEARIKQLIIDKNKLSDLEVEFNAELNPLLIKIQTRLKELETQYAAKKAAWDQLFDAYPVMKNSKKLLMSADHNQRDYSYYDLRGIRLSNRNFSTAEVIKVKFEHAALTHCTFASRLDGVNFSGANVSTCNFDNANFQNVIIDKNTKIDQKYHRQILRDNFANPDYHNTPQYYEALLQCIPPTADDVLNILKAIATAPVCPNKSTEQQLIARKARAVMVIERMLPKLQSIEEVVKLKELIDTKHQGANNPFAYIRQERDWLKNIFGFTHGNTGTWQKISEKIKNHLFALSRNCPDHSLQKQTYQDAKVIMKTHTAYDYGFGFFYTPAEASQWKQEKSRLVASPSIH